VNGWLPRDPFTLTTVVLLGLCFGSFLNVVIYRLPLGLSLLRPRSRCGACGTQIRWYHNVPVLGWFALRGKCAACGGQIAFRYPLVEAIGAALFALAMFGFPRPIESLAASWVFLSLLVVFFVDLDHRIIPDEISLGGTVLGLLLSHWTIGILPAVIAAAAGAGGLFLVGWGYARIRGRQGMGLGDVKLAAMLGAFLGLQGLVLTVLLASFLGALTGIGLVSARRGNGLTALPFGSFLAPAAVLALFWGPGIWSWYLGFFPQATP
jgi:leader peptidase (prepilin peptidase)/N-methyltransferase